MTDEILKTNHLFKIFGNRTVVNDVSFNVKQGEVVGLLGPNGAGKTTSFYMTVGLLRPTKGTVFLNEQDITTLPIHKRAKLGLGYLPQNSSVFKKLTVEDNLTAIMEVCGIESHKRKSLLENLIERFGIGHIRKSLGMSLSGGERMRLRFAIVFGLKPDLIILDEPFSGLDPVNSNLIKEEIRALIRRKIIFNQQMKMMS